MPLPRVTVYGLTAGAVVDSTPQPFPVGTTCLASRVVCALTNARQANTSRRLQSPFRICPPVLLFGYSLEPHVERRAFADGAAATMFRCSKVKWQNARMSSP